MTSRTPTLLLIDDFLPDLELYRRYLLADSKHVYHLLEAGTASAGLELCRTQIVDAILLDYSLPDFDGLSFLEALHSQSNGNSPPVVMITGQGDEVIAARAIKLGAEDYLVKRHLTPELLQVTMHSAVENARLRLHLQQSENRFQTSVENMLDCFGIYSAIRDEAGQIVDFRIDYLNAAALKSNRMSASDIGKPLCEVLPKHRDIGLFDQYRRVVELGEPLVKENFIYTDAFGPELLTRAFDLHVSKFEDGFVASWRDVTARKQAELERQQQLERERIVNQITRQIHQSLDVERVLGTAVNEVRRFLSGDRAFIYRFNPDFSGVIVVESVAEGWRTALNAQIEDTCFIETGGEDYRLGQIQAIEDIYTAGLSDCHVEMLAQFQIRANLVVPILQGENLWGLLVLNQCARPRCWQPSEIDLLRQLAAQIGIAIQQAELHQQVQAELTERRRVEAQLRESQNFIQQVSDAAPGFLYLYDLIEQRNLYSNQRIVDILGYTPEEIKSMGENLLTYLMHPADFAQVPDHLAKFNTAQPKDIFEFEYRMRHANGEWRWLFAREIVYSRTPEGQPHQILGLAQEISDRKQNEQRLRESEERLQLGVQVAGVAIAHFDYATDLVTLSPEATALYGFPADQTRITRQQIHATFHPEERDELFALIAQVLDPEGAGWFSREHRVIWPNGDVRWLNVRKQVIFDRSGAVPRPDYGILAAIDITERKRNEMSIRENEQRFRAIIDNSKAAIFLKDLQGRYLLMNRECEQLFHTTNDWICGKTDYDLFPKDVADRLRSTDQQVLAAGDAVKLEETVPLQDGIHTYVAVKFPLLDSAGTPYALCGISTDISDRVRLQADRDQLLLEAQAARAEAEAANHSKDEFVSLVAHELRSPLNAILGWAKLIQTRQFDEAMTQKALEIIIRNTEAQVQLVEDLLDVSRMVRGTLTLEFTSVNLVDVVEAAIETMRPTLEAKPLHLETEIYPVAMIQGDASRLQQVVLNLLTNAVKFTPAEGRVRVRLEQLPSHVQMQVSDTGKGISASFLPHIFERFQQDQQNATTKQGLGLGLALVRYIVEQHGGTITVQSDGEGQGATFTVLLPLLPMEPCSQADSAALSPVAIFEQTLSGVQVLLVDDEPDLLDLTAFVLEQAGAVVQTARNATAALACLTQFQPDLLISDLAMPEQDGYELLQQIRQSNPHQNFPAIALTAYAVEDYGEESLRAGFAYHLMKPVEPEELVRVVLSVLQLEVPHV